MERHFCHVLIDPRNGRAALRNSHGPVTQNIIFYDV